MPVIPYIKNPTWADGSGGGTSIDAVDLNKIEAGIFEAHQMPAVRVTHNAAQSILNNTLTKIAFNTERFDTAGGAASTQHDTITNNTRLTCLFAGKYQIIGNVEFASNATGVRYLDVFLNNVTIISAEHSVAVNGGTHGIQISTLYDLAVNDFVELRAFQNSGGALNVNVTGNWSPEFMMVRIA